ncbi:MAG: hypothetical protein SFV20_00695 [Sphingopyxis sp.]|nr:hypothetical protein [Sphingopyxis sp.]
MRHADRSWLPPVVAAFPAADFFVPVMPNQLLLAGLSALSPRRWPIFALAFAAGTASGGMAIAYAVQFIGVTAAGFAGADEAVDAVSEITRYLRLHGLWYLAAIALLPWTPRLTVLACAMVEIHPLAILVTLFFARLVPSAALGISGAFGPRLAKRFVLLQRLSVRLRKFLHS